ncbi:MAG: DinB family protein [Bacteroidota bacterium]
MYRTIQDFVKSWTEESASTLKLFKNLKDDSLNHLAYEGGRTIGDIAWHIVVTAGEMPKSAGLEAVTPTEHEDTPVQVQTYLDTYLKASKNVIDEVGTKWNDAMLDEEIELYGEKWKRGYLLDALIKHQAHHRGQLMILMRQANLNVIGVYGPSKEEWASYGMPAQK